MATQASDKQTKQSRITRRFKSESDPSGNAARTSNDVTDIIFTAANGKTLDCNLAVLFGGKLPPPSVGRAAAAAGLSNAIGGAGLADDVNTEDPDEVMDAMQERFKALQSGTWTAPHRGGGRPSMVWQAFVAFRQSKNLKDSDAKLADLKTHWFEDETNFKALQANPDFAVYLASYKAQHSKQKADTPATKDLLA